MRQWLALCATACAASFSLSAAVNFQPRHERRFLGGHAGGKTHDVAKSKTSVLQLSLLTPSQAWTTVWNNLNAGEVTAAKILGWDPVSWDRDTPPQSSRTSWSDLTGSQRNSLQLFGWNSTSWDTSTLRRSQAPPSWQLSWANLTVNQSAAAAVLGFDKDLWDGSIPPLGYSRLWAALSSQEKDAASVFAWTPIAWNLKPSGPICTGVAQAFYDPWEDLSFSQNAAARILGWNETMWDNSRWRPLNTSLFPPSNEKNWTSLTPKEQAAAALFCWDAASWNHAEPFKMDKKGPHPLPLCNWTIDWEGVARPANCSGLGNGNITCARSVNQTFVGAESWCIAPTVASCQDPIKMTGKLDGVRYAFSKDVLNANGEIPHGMEFDISCSSNATAVDHRYPLESWMKTWYPGTTVAQAVCNNGTIIRMETAKESWEPFYKPAGIKPLELRCVLKERVKLTQDMISYLRWTEPRMHEAETKGYKWIDMDAIMHKKILKGAMNESSTWEKSSRNQGKLASIRDLKRIIKLLIDYRMIPRGQPMNQQTCKDLEKHWLFELENTDPFKKAGNIGYANYVPAVDPKIGIPLAKDISLKRAVPFQCSYTLQKTAAGYDSFTLQLNYHYRDGCFCTSRWMNGCPFRADFSPNFRTFGFDALEIKEVSRAMGASTNALCWYFTKPANPEWGYLKSDLGYAFQAPVKNVTQLKSDWLDLKKLAQAARFESTR